MAEDDGLIKPGEIAFHLELTAAQLKIVHTALKSLFDDLGHEEHEVRDVVLSVLAKLPGEHEIRAIDLARELTRDLKRPSPGRTCFIFGRIGKPYPQHQSGQPVAPGETPCQRPPSSPRRRAQHLPDANASDPGTRSVKTSRRARVRSRARTWRPRSSAPATRAG